MSRGRSSETDKSQVQKHGSKQRASDLLAQKLKASAEKKRDRFTDLDKNPMFKEAAQSVGDFRSLSYSMEVDSGEQLNRAGASSVETTIEDHEINSFQSVSGNESLQLDESKQFIDPQKIPDSLLETVEELHILKAKNSDGSASELSVGNVLPTILDSDANVASLDEPENTEAVTKDSVSVNISHELDQRVRSSTRSVVHSGRTASLLKPSWDSDFSKDTFEVFKIVHNITGPRYSYLASGYCALYEKARASGTITLHLNRILLSEILGTHSSGTVTRFLKKGVEFGLFVSQSFTVKSAVAQSGTYVHLCVPWK